MDEKPARTRAVGLSIGAKLALRYALATAATITVLGAFVYGQIERRINRQATLVIEVQARDLVDELAAESAQLSRDQVVTWFDEKIHHQIASTPPDLDLGIDFVDPTGRVLASGGSLERAGPPLASGVAAGSEPSVRAVDLGGDYAHLLMTAPAVGGFVRVAIDTQRFARNVEEVRRVFLLTLPAVLVITGLLGWALARASLRPIHQINRTARLIGGRDLRASIARTGTGDELDQLAETLNDMIERIAASMARERRFTGNAAHQLMTPLAAMRNQIDVTLERERDAREYVDALEGVGASAARMAEELDAMLRLARSEGGLPDRHRKPCDVAAVLRTVIEFFQPFASEEGVKLSVEEGAEATVLGDESWLTQLFSNVLSNAIKFTPADGRVALRWQVHGGRIDVRIADTGPGIEGGNPEAVFERFHRDRASAGTPGFGLGLPIAREIARAHGGDVVVESSSSDGTTMRISLPIEARSESR